MYGKASEILVLIKGIFNHETPVRVDLILALTEETPMPGKGQSAASRQRKKHAEAKSPAPPC